MTADQSMTYRQAAQAVLTAADEPLDYREITQWSLDRKLIQSTGRTPEATMNAQMSMEVERRSETSIFIEQC